MADSVVIECVKVGKLMMKSEVAYMSFDVYCKRGMSHLLINSGSNLSIFNEMVLWTNITHFQTE